MNDCREQFYELLKEKGYESFRAFCREVNIFPGNLHKNLKSTESISIQRMFIVANALHEPIGRIIEMFYPEEVAENKKSFS